MAQQQWPRIKSVGDDKKNKSEPRSGSTIMVTDAIHGIIKKKK